MHTAIYSGRVKMALCQSKSACKGRLKYVKGNHAAMNNYIYSLMFAQEYGALS
jgi:hypothetical protein